MAAETEPLYPFQYKTLWRLYRAGPVAVATVQRGRDVSPHLRSLRQVGLVRFEPGRPGLWSITAAGIEWLEQTGVVS